MLLGVPIVKLVNFSAKKPLALVVSVKLAIPLQAMSRRIEIELTSSLEDGNWTWRAAGARQPKGVVAASLLPDGAKVGDELKVEVEQMLDGLSIVGVVQGRAKSDRTDLLELLPIEKDFQPVVETRAKRERGERRGDREGRGGRRNKGGRRGEGRGEGRREGRGDGGGDGKRGEGRGRREGRRGPNFSPPPEVPQRPRPKRLRAGKAHRNEVLSGLPEEQRPIAELTLQGMSAVRQRLRDENKRALAEGRAEMPEGTVLKLAEDLLPRLRVAEWRDRAEAAQRQMEHLDLRDLRSVVAAANDPVVARDDSTTALAKELAEALVTKQEQELQLWFGDVDAALAVGRVIRALRLSSQPPKAGVPFPTDISQRLVDSTNAALAPTDSPDRWAAMLEAAAFSPIRASINPVRKPNEVNDDLLATVKRLGPALPQIAALFEVEVDPNAPMPKPQRPGPRGRKGEGGRKPRKPKQADAPTSSAPDKTAGNDNTAGNDSAVEAVAPAADTGEAVAAEQS